MIISARHIESLHTGLYFHLFYIKLVQFKQFKIDISFFWLPRPPTLTSGTTDENKTLHTPSSLPSSWPCSISTCASSGLDVYNSYPSPTPSWLSFSPPGVVYAAPPATYPRAPPKWQRPCLSGLKSKSLKNPNTSQHPPKQSIRPSQITLLMVPAIF